MEIVGMVAQVFFKRIIESGRKSFHLKANPRTLALHQVA
jgi:hypothetical protein